MVKSCCWPLEKLGQAIPYFLARESTELPSPVHRSELPVWLNWVTHSLQCECNPADVSLRDLPFLIAHAKPSIYEVEGQYLLVLQAGKTLRVLTPDLTQRRIPAAALVAALSQPFEAPFIHDVEKIIDACGLKSARKKRALSNLLNEQTGAVRFGQCWTFTATNQRSFVWTDLPQLVMCHLAQYLLWLASWGVLGTLTFTGHMDRGWLLAWALLLLTLIPFRILALWTQGRFAIRLGTTLKRLLLQGALRSQPEAVRASGIGAFLGQALEGESIETLAISGAIGGLLALLEIIPALFILGRLAILLAIWCMVACLAAWWFFRSYGRWTAKRMDLTNHLVEVMVGHRTRLAQQPRGDWHTTEDPALAQYLATSENVDRSGSWLMAAVPRGWLLFGLAGLAPSIIAGRSLDSETAVLLGGVLLAFSAFQRLVASFADIAGAIVGWQRVKPLLDASQRIEAAGKIPPSSGASRKNQLLLEAEGLTFAYAGQLNPVLRDCHLSIRRGDRLLLQGPSGGGKTTLGSLLTGIRHPQSGLLLINGLDRHTLGESAWRKQVASAPQFHENHLITETLAFNLLMGRGWPPSTQDLEEAQNVCEELGLGKLLERMPGGLMQMVGEGGWQLSHGERSRIYLARALLQNADLVILDESFAALDPENLQLTMETTFRRAETLLVIAHP